MLTCMEIPASSQSGFSLSSYIELRFSSIDSWSVICSCTVLDSACLTKRFHCIRLLLSVLERGGVSLAPNFPLSHLTIRTLGCHQELRQRERKNKALLEEVKTDEWNLENRKKNIPNGDVTLLSELQVGGLKLPYFSFCLSLWVFFLLRFAIIEGCAPIRGHKAVRDAPALCAKQTAITVSDSR